MDTTTKVRDHTFDNIRALLIILVVLGHMLSGHTGSKAVKAIYYFIYFFHMPVFIFITGYFSKNIEKSREQAFKNFLIPYLFFNILYTLLGKVDLFNKYSSIRLFSPVYGMWFLLAVFLWKIMLKDLVRIRFILPISFAIGILSGFSEEFSSYMTLARAINYLPFFLLGYFTTSDHIKKMKEFPKWMAYMILMLFGAIAYIIVEYKLINTETIYLRKAYSYAKQSDLTSVLGRLFIYFAGFMILICLFNIFENKERWYTSIGRNSLTVYIIHLFIVVNIKEFRLPFEEGKWYLLYSIIVAVLISFILSRQLIMDIYNVLMSVIYKIIFNSRKKLGKVINYNDRS